MNIKKLTLSRYLLRTVVVAAPAGFVITGLIVYSIKSVIVAAVLGLVLNAVFGAFISLGNYKKLIAPMKDTIGDLDIIIGKSNIDEIGQIENATDVRRGFGIVINSMVENLKAMTGRICNATGAIIQTAEQTAAGSIQIGSNIHEVSVTIRAVANSTREIADLSNQTDLFAKEGVDAVKRISRQVEVIQQVSIENGKTIESLHQSMQEISQITNLINSVAGQTNLLALNAAIEAARAGEHGRGFAVVAQEVRQLAEQSSNATKQIQDTINTIVENSQRAVTGIAEGIEEAKAGFVIVQEVEKRFTQIISAIGSLLERTTSVASSAEQVRVAIQNVSTATEGQSASMEEATAMIHEFDVLTGELTGIANKFSLSQPMS
ncbi:MAG TPA: methyl-accepting chemotaxis protein [Spirochaetia bacterium]|nr:methyl-accepting chemotaxis protein [Spirochaetia bacterium]